MTRRITPIYLPDSYRWSHGSDGATLFLRFGAVASVAAGEVKIMADGPSPEVTGPCSSIDQGMRFAERFIQARTCYGLTPEQAERFYANKRWRARWMPRRPNPEMEGAARRTEPDFGGMLAPGPEDDELLHP